MDSKFFYEDIILYILSVTKKEKYKKIMSKFGLNQKDLIFLKNCYFYSLNGFLTENKAKLAEHIILKKLTYLITNQRVKNDILRSKNLKQRFTLPSNEEEMKKTTWHCKIEKNKNFNNRIAYFYNGYCFFEHERNSSIIKEAIHLYKKLPFLKCGNSEFVNIGKYDEKSKITVVKVCNQNSKKISRFLEKFNFENKDEIKNILVEKYISPVFDFQIKNERIIVNTNCIQAMLYVGNLVLEEGGKYEPFRENMEIKNNLPNLVRLELLKNLVLNENNETYYKKYKNYIKSKYFDYENLTNKNVIDILAYLELGKNPIFVNYTKFDYIDALCIFCMENHKNLNIFLKDDFDHRFHEKMRKLKKKVEVKNQTFIVKSKNKEKTENFSVNIESKNSIIENIVSISFLVNAKEDNNFSENLINNKNTYSGIITNKLVLESSLVPFHGSFLFKNENISTYETFADLITSNDKKRNISLFRYFYFKEKLHKIEKNNDYQYNKIKQVLELNNIFFKDT